jgi:hypothetical protein
LKMTDKSKAWVWEQYQAVIAESGSHNSDAGEERVVRFETIRGSKESNMDQKDNEARIKFGAAIAISIVLGAFFPMIALLLFLIAILLIASGKEPKKTQDYLAGLPGGEHAIKALAQVDRWLS